MGNTFYTKSEEYNIYNVYVTGGMDPSGKMN